MVYKKNAIPCLQTKQRRNALRPNAAHDQNSVLSTEPGPALCLKFTPMSLFHSARCGRGRGALMFHAHMTQGEKRAHSAQFGHAPQPQPQPKKPAHLKQQAGSRTRPNTDRSVSVSALSHRAHCARKTEPPPKEKRSGDVADCAAH